MGPDVGDDVAILCRNTTEAINQLAYRLRLDPDDIVLTTVVEHHANLLPWGRVARRRYVECGRDGTFDVDDVIAGLDRLPVPRLLTLTGASNVTGWLPALPAIIEAAHARGVPVVLDAAQLAPHRPIPAEADYVAFSGHKMYAPYGAGVLVGPRTTFVDGDPFLAGGGAVDLVDLDEVVWTEPPEREEAGSPNVVGAVALEAALDTLGRIGWPTIGTHEAALARRLRAGSTRNRRRPPSRAGSRHRDAGDRHLHRRGRPPRPGRRPAQRGVGYRRPPRMLLCPPVSHPPPRPVRNRDPELSARVSCGATTAPMPGAVRASCGISSTAADVDTFLAAVTVVATTGRRAAPRRSRTSRTSARAISGPSPTGPGGRATTGTRRCPVRRDNGAELSRR